jgi:hypothetical protein
LKTELYDRHSLATRAEAIEAVSRWITEVYNTRTLAVLRISGGSQGGDQVPVDASGVE